MKPRGFTVIEVLIALAIISLGAALIYPHFNNPIKWSTQKCNQVNLEGLNSAIKILQLNGYSNQLLGNNDADHNKRVLALLINPPWGESIIDASSIEISKLSSVGSGSHFRFDKYQKEQAKGGIALKDVKMPKYPNMGSNKAWSSKKAPGGRTSENQKAESPEVDLAEVEKLADLVFKRSENE